MDFLVHLALFVVASLAIVLLGCFHGEAHDAAALRCLPRRLGVFIGGCTVLALVILLLEHTFASIT